MKHLTTYKLFENESDDEIKSTMDDILLDLKDEGFECHCNVGWGSSGLSLELRIYNSDEAPDGHGGFRSMRSMMSEFEFWNGIEDVMNRIYSYLSSISDKATLYYIFDGDEGEEEISVPLKQDTLKKMFPEYFRDDEGGFIIYFENILSNFE